MPLKHSDNFLYKPFSVDVYSKIFNHWRYIYLYMLFFMFITSAQKINLLYQSLNIHPIRWQTIARNFHTNYHNIKTIAGVTLVLTSSSALQLMRNVNKLLINDLDVYELCIFEVSQIAIFLCFLFLR